MANAVAREQVAADRAFNLPARFCRYLAISKSAQAELFHFEPSIRAAAHERVLAGSGATPESRRP